MFSVMSFAEEFEAESEIGGLEGAFSAHIPLVRSPKWPTVAAPKLEALFICTSFWKKFVVAHGASQISWSTVDQRRWVRSRMDVRPYLCMQLGQSTRPLHRAHMRMGLWAQPPVDRAPGGGVTTSSQSPRKGRRSLTTAPALRAARIIRTWETWGTVRSTAAFW